MKTLKSLLNVVLITMTIVFQINAQIIQENKPKHDTEAIDIRSYCLFQNTPSRRISGKQLANRALKPLIFFGKLHRGFSQTAS